MRAADRLRRRARRAVGRERERLQRARPAPHLSVPRLRRARPGAQARARPGPGGRAVRLGARRHGRPAARRSPTSRALEEWARSGRYGFRDALDYTRPDPDSDYAVVRTYMAHHIGMGLVALTNVLDRAGLAAALPRRPAGALGGAAAARADSAPAGAAEAAARAELDEALPERGARAAGGARARHAGHAAAARRAAGPPALHHHGEPLRRRVQPLRGRWRSPAGAPTGRRDDTGQFCYVKDLSSGRVWSAAHQPVCAPADWYHA